MAGFSLPSNLFVYKRVTSAAPAAGAEITPFVVPTGKWWQLLAAYVSLTQGLTQTPQPILQVDDGTNLVAEFPGSSAVQAASTTTGYTWGPDVTTTGQVGTGATVRAAAAMASLFLPGGYRVKTVTVGIGANSQYGAPALYVVEYG